MTCIVGIVRGGTVYMGGDSCGASSAPGWVSTTSTIHASPKVFVNGGVGFGYTTSFRMGQLLEHALVVPPHPEGMTPQRFVHGPLLNAITECFRAGGYLLTKDGRIDGGMFLIGYRGHLFIMQDDFALIQNVFGFNAVGSGAAVAMGSMHTTQDLGWEVGDRMRAALDAAVRHCTGVLPPFHFVELK